MTTERVFTPEKQALAASHPKAVFPQEPPPKPRETPPTACFFLPRVLY